KAKGDGGDDRSHPGTTRKGGARFPAPPQPRRSAQALRSPMPIEARAASASFECAVEDHPMIDSLWAQRRSVVRVSVPLSGWRRGAAFRLARAAEDAARAVKTFRRVPNAVSQQPDDPHA
ncbi:hypothetical protein, partial [Streptomyces niveus]|uniref:hypothetical protein n=1 Tax=Streptomyces niveus TaxID=193462 RepID=UPI003432110D